MLKPNPVIIVGGGLAGLVAAYELTQQKIPVIILDQENAGNLGGQAFWSLGGLFIVNSAEQRRVGVKDSRELAMADWMNTARFDREREDYWPRQWAEAFVNFAADDFEDYVKGLGLKFTSVGWAERGDGRAGGHGNSVPRFHLSWGTGPEVVKIFEEPVKRAEKEGLVQFRFRHRVDEIVLDETTGRAIGVRGKVLEPSEVARGASSSRKELDDFEVFGSTILVSSGGIGGDTEKVRKNWPLDRLGPKAPKSFIIGVPQHVDGRMVEIAQKVGVNMVNADRMWHYTEGISNFNPIWPSHGIRVLPGPSSLWLDATGKRLPPFLYPGSDTLATLKYICSTGYDYSWFILDRTIIAKEFALSGSEQNPDITGKSLWGVFKRIFGGSGTVPVQNFQKFGEDFVVREELSDLVAGMNELSAKAGGPRLDYDQIRGTVDEFNAQLVNKYSKDAQVMLINNARQFWPENWARVAKAHQFMDKAHGPMIAVRMHLLTRKTLGGLETNMQSNAMKADGTPFPGLYAAGEAAGFGGGGVHGYASLEGTFLGGCIFSGRAAGKAIAASLLERKEKENGVAAKL